MAETTNDSRKDPQLLAGLLAHELPESFNEVQVGRIRRLKLEDEQVLMGLSAVGTENVIALATTVGGNDARPALAVQDSAPCRSVIGGRVRDPTGASWTLLGQVEPAQDELGSSGAS
jgi:hypothetical protein